MSFKAPYVNVRVIHGTWMGISCGAAKAAAIKRD